MLMRPIENILKMLGSKFLPDILKNNFRGPFIHTRSVSRSFFLKDFSFVGDGINLRINSPVQISVLYLNGKPMTHCSEQNSGTNVFFLTKNALEPWENILTIPAESPEKKLDFVLEYHIDAVTGVPDQINDTDWGDFSFEKNIHIRAAWGFIQNSYNNSKESEFRGTFYPCFDNTNATYRLNSWIWCSAIVVEALFDEMNMHIEFQSKAYEIAKSVGDVLLDRWDRDNKSAAGGVVIRWDISPSSPIGIVPWRAPNDIAFIGAYAFLPLYHATLDKKYLHAALEMGRWILENGFLPNGHLFAGYRDDLSHWDRSWLYVDSGYTSKLFARLYLATNDIFWKNAAIQFIDWYIENFYSKSGFFKWVWPWRFWNSGKKIFTRGQAWALDGVLSAYQISGDKKYLEIARQVAFTLLKYQNDDGSWPYILTRHSSGPCNKGTPILAYHLLRIYELTGEDFFGDSARKAIQWCENNQCLIEIQHFEYGGIFSKNEEGSIVGQANVSTAFLYASAYYSMAKNLDAHLSKARILNEKYP